jgi:hypothetical protein
MKLVAFRANPTDFQPVRNLTDEELTAHRRFTKPFMEAENRFLLFRILELNYQEWISYIRSLLSIGGSKKDSRLKLNQLLLNYLTVSYSITQHFQTGYRQKFRNQSNMMERYDTFLERLHKSCWAFSFFQDFRNYVQHCELPIGAYSRTESRYKIELSITHDASLLLRNYKRWGKCALTAAHGTLDLIELLQDYHVRMIQDYATFVAKSFFPFLTEANQFYSALTNEALKKYPDHRMVFGEVMSTPNDDGTNAVNLNYSHVPNNVYSELGIQKK